MNEIILKGKKHGMLVLILTILLYIAATVGCIVGAAMGGWGTAVAVICVIYLCIGWFPLMGLRVLKPQEALVLTLFGKYIGTLKEEGFYAVNPFCGAVNPAWKTRLNQWIRGALTKAETDESRLFLQGLLDSLPEMQISTIHSFCQRVLNDYPLESGVGFAPEFDSEEGGPDSRSEIFFNEAWNTGMCPDSVNAGIRQEMMLGAFTMLNNKSNVQPQFMDTRTEAGRAFANDTLDMCKRLIALFSGAVESVDPSISDERPILYWCLFQFIV